MSQISSEISRIGWRFDNSYARLPDFMLSRLGPTPVKSPELMIINSGLSKELGLDFSKINKKDLALIFSGNFLPEGSETIAQAYAGHQFGHFTMLGDGRAIVVGEHITKNNKRFDIQFKGSGKTPYSRNADGRAALGPMLREYIISEAMYGLKIPTTRSLAVVTTGENVVREEILRGAILTRVASSHLRVGTFQYVAMSNDIKNLKILLNYSIDRHYPNLKSEKNSAIGLLRTVMKKQVELVTNWMRVGFIHGVMNTDNMTISGDTIDYGPCAFMDKYDPETVFSSIDYYGRYAYFNQPSITKWNLTRFAETLIPLIDKNQDKAIEIAKEEIKNFENLYKRSWLEMMKKKLGIYGNNINDESLINKLLGLMHKNDMDYTNTFHFLMNDKLKNNKEFQDVKFFNWYKEWKIRLEKNNKPFESSLSLMKQSNPLVIPRNYKVEEVLDKANKNNNFEPIHNFLNFLRKPYEEQSGIKNYQLEPKRNGKEYKTFCGT